MTEIRFKSNVLLVPCDCEDGPCDWAHYGPGEARYFVDGEEVTADEAKTVYDQEIANGDDIVA